MSCTRDFHVGDKTHFIGSDLRDMREQVGKLEAARKAYLAIKTGKVTKESTIKAMESKIAESGVWDNFKQMDDAASNGLFHPKSKFELLEEGQRTNPLGKKQGRGITDAFPEASTLATREKDMIETSKAFFTKREGRVTNLDGRVADIKSPLEVAQNGLNRAIKRHSVATLKLRMGDSFVATFKDVLDDRFATTDPFVRMMESKFIKNPTSEQAALIEKAKSVRDNMIRFLGTPTELDISIANTHASFIRLLDEKMAADYKSTNLSALARAFYSKLGSVAEKAPPAAMASFARQWVYYTALAFTPKQLFVQGWQFTTALAANPRWAGQASSMPFLLRYAADMSEENIRSMFTDTVFKKYMLKSLGIDEETFIAMVKAKRDLGVSIVAHTNSTFDGLGKAGLQFTTSTIGRRLSTAGTYLINAAERFVQEASFVAAFLEHTNGKVASKLTKQDLAEIGRKATIYAGSMTRENKSAAEMRLSIATQFLTYMFRNTENLMNKELSRTQRLSIILFNYATLGIAGADLGLNKWYPELLESGDFIFDKEDNSAPAKFFRDMHQKGLVNIFIQDALGADINATDALAPNNILGVVKDLVDSDKNMAEILGGASYNSGIKAIDTLGSVIKLYSSSNDPTSPSTLALAAQIMAKNAGLFSSFVRYYYLSNHNTLLTRKGGIVATNYDANLQTELGVLLGFTTQTESNIWNSVNVAKELKDGEEGIVKVASEVINAGVASGDPSKAAKNIDIARAILLTYTGDNAIQYSKLYKKALDRTLPALESQVERLLKEGKISEAIKLQEDMKKEGDNK